jgi:hypothetical protein
MNTRLKNVFRPSGFASASRAQFSPVSPRRRVALAAREFAERSFLSRWTQPGLLNRAQPLLTHYHE